MRSTTGVLLRSGLCLGVSIRSLHEHSRSSLHGPLTIRSVVGSILSYHPYYQKFHLMNRLLSNHLKISAAVTHLILAPSARATSASQSVCHSHCQFCISQCQSIMAAPLNRLFFGFIAIKSIRTQVFSMEIDSSQRRLRTPLILHDIHLSTLPVISVIRSRE